MLLPWPFVTSCFLSYLFKKSCAVIIGLHSIIGIDENSFYIGYNVIPLKIFILFICCASLCIIT